jgi:hypothetical protein
VAWLAAYWRAQSMPVWTHFADWGIQSKAHQNKCPGPTSWFEDLTSERMQQLRFWLTTQDLSDSKQLVVGPRHFGC